MTPQEQEKKALTFEYMQKINFILRKMRYEEKGLFEVVKQGEAPENRGKLTVEKVDFPETGGVYTHFEGIPPMKGFPDGETVERVDEAKKMVMRILWGFYRMPKIKFFLLVLLRKQMETLAENLMVSYWEYIKKYKFKPIRYCKAVREIYRVFEEMGDPKGEEGIDLWKMIRDDVCITMESDDAYRYRFQLAIADLNKDELKKNPVGEIKRLIKIISDREENEGMRDKYQMLSRYLFLLRFKPKLFKTIIEFLMRLNIDELKLDSDDLYHAKTKILFNWENINV